METQEIQDGVFTKPEWNTKTKRFSCVQNGFGQWWPRLRVKAQSGGWCDIIIRNSDPFKTLNGAIKFVETTKARIEAKEAK